MKKLIFCILKVTAEFGMDLHLDPLVRGTDMRIRNTALLVRYFNRKR
jgi:hypothetical protein